MENRLKKIIYDKGNALGTFLGVATPSILESVSSTGLDFVVIDCEHGTYDSMFMSDMIRTAESRGITPFVRIADLTHGAMQQALDNGAEGIIIPCLRTLDDFRKVVDLGKFAPLGNRGFIKGRGSSFGNDEWAKGSLDEFMKNSNEKVLLLPQCETKEALDNIEEIVRIEGIDGIFIGPFDLSICMGIPGRFDDPRFKSAMERIFQACKSAGKLCMTFTMSPEEAKGYFDKGYDAVGCGLDSSIIADAYRMMVKTVRE